MHCRYVPDAAGETPPEIAGCCIQAPKVQAQFLLGIIEALQRRKWELQTVKHELKESKQTVALLRREVGSQFPSH
jgi:hypothetical protein